MQAETMDIFEQRYQARRKAELVVGGGGGGRQGGAISLNMPPLALMDVRRCSLVLACV
jgi:hypothetical protein